MTDFISPYLRRPLRSEAQARAELAARPRLAGVQLPPNNHDSRVETDGQVYLQTYNESPGFHSVDVLRVTDGLLLGRLVNRKDGFHRAVGWRYFPFYQRNPSRKGWPSAAQALKNYGLTIKAEIPKGDSS